MELLQAEWQVDRQLGGDLCQCSCCMPTVCSGGTGRGGRPLSSAPVLGNNKFEDPSLSSFLIKLQKFA